MALARGMQAFGISVAKHLNAQVGARAGKRRRGSVFADRYHAVILRSPRQVRNTLSYVLNNWRKHGGRAAARVRARARGGARAGSWRGIPRARLADATCSSTARVSGHFHEEPFVTRILTPTETLPGYDRWAESYDTAANPLMAMSACILDLEPLGVAGLDVIELGCGTGRNAPRVLGEGARSYTGVDGSAGMLARARATDDPRARWVTADLQAPWHTSERCDLALVVLVLEHLASLVPLATTLATIVRPGGRVRIVDIHPALVASGTVAHFHDRGEELRFASVAHDEPALRAAFAGWKLGVRSWLADDDMIARVPRLAKHRGRPVMIDVSATR